MTYKLPPYFLLKRYRPDIENTHPELNSVKNIAVLISTKLLSNNTWFLELIEHPQAILQYYEIVESANDMWFDHTVPTFSVSSDNKMNRVVMKFNNYVAKNNYSSIPLLKMSEPCVTLPLEFFNLNKEFNKSFSFELNLNHPIQQVSINTNLHILEFITKGETCPISMHLLTKNTIRVTSCNHAFSKDVEKWIIEKKSCPVCRAPQTLESLSKWTP
jgi:hypothetical protein